MKQSGQFESGGKGKRIESHLDQSRKLGVIPTVDESLDNLVAQMRVAGPISRPSITRPKGNKDLVPVGPLGQITRGNIFLPGLSLPLKTRGLTKKMANPVSKNIKLKAIGGLEWSFKRVALKKPMARVRRTAKPHLQSLRKLKLSAK